MPNISVEPLGNLTEKVTITVPYSEYGKPVTDELKKIRKGASFKGFRPGKAPMSFIRKMYGQQIIAKFMNEALQTKMMEYLEDKDIFGQPIPIEQIEKFNLKSKEDFNFEFEIGLEPEFELNLPTEPFDLEVIKADEKYVERELREMRHRQGEVVEDGEEVTSKNDVLKVMLRELEGDEVKEGGIESETYISLDLFVEETLIESVIGLKPGATFDAKYTELTKEFTSERIKKYVLKLEQDEEGNYPEFNEMFRAEILSIRQVQLAELNQEFFDKTLGAGLATTEEEFRAKLGERVANYLQSEADARWFNKVQVALVDGQNMEFPEAFLKKWLLFRNEEKTEEEAESEMPDFLKSLKWMLIKSKIQKQHDLEVSQEAIREAIKNQFRQYMKGQANDDMLDMMADNVLNSDEERTTEMRERGYQDALLEVVVEKLKETLPSNEIEITTSEFDEILTKDYEKREKEEAAKAVAEIETNLETAEAEIEEVIEDAIEVVEDVEVVEVAKEVIEDAIEVVEEEVVTETELEDLATEIEKEVETLIEEAEVEINE